MKVLIAPLNESLGLPTVTVSAQCKTPVRQVLHAQTYQFEEDPVDTFPQVRSRAHREGCGARTKTSLGRRLKPIGDPESHHSLAVLAIHADESVA